MSTMSQTKESIIPEALLTRACPPCAKDAVPLTKEVAMQKLQLLDGWQLIEEGKAISRRFEFKNFKTAIAFVNQVGEVAEVEKHHPDITLGWGYAGMRLQTHSINGLHENDFTVASKINSLFGLTK